MKRATLEVTKAPQVYERHICKLDRDIFFICDSYFKTNFKFRATGAWKSTSKVVACAVGGKQNTFLCDFFLIYSPNSLSRYLTLFWRGSLESWGRFRSFIGRFYLSLLPVVLCRGTFYGGWARKERLLSHFFCTINYTMCSASVSVMTLIKSRFLTLKTAPPCMENVSARASHSAIVFLDKSKLSNWRKKYIMQNYLPYYIWKSWINSCKVKREKFFLLPSGISRLIFCIS